MVQANPETPAQAVEGCFRGAPTLVFVANAKSYDFSAIDCGLLSENIMLSAWSLGVGSVCLGSPIRFINKSPEALEMLGFSEDYTPIICIGLGYPDEQPEAKPRDMGKVKFID
jgi:nitroreductase